MHISPIQNITTLPNPQFKANNRRICNKSGDLLYKTTTYFFRDDLHWDALVSLLSEKYRNTARVNVINHACSNGEEPYSLVVKLLHSLGDTAEKFFPIKAKDIDQDNINSAKAGRMGIILNDMYRINGYTKDNINTYFDYEKALNPMNDMVLSPKSNIKDKVQFTRADIFDELDTMQGHNTVLLCRNVWPYMTPEKRELLAEKLSKTLDKTSLLVTGSFDESVNIPQILKDKGFINAGIPRTFTKK